MQFKVDFSLFNNCIFLFLSFSPFFSSIFVVLKFWWVIKSYVVVTVYDIHKVNEDDDDKGESNNNSNNNCSNENSDSNENSYENNDTEIIDINIYETIANMRD